MQNIPINVLYHQDGILIAQTHAGRFDKFDPNDVYGQFNLGLHVGDDPKAVLARRARLLEYLSWLSNDKINSLHWLDQVHSNHVVKVGKLSATPAPADALFGDRAGQALAIMTADCVPVVVFGGGQVACIHAGWQGLVKGVIGQSVAQFDRTAPLYAVIGACICQDSYQIDQTLANRIVSQVVADKRVAMDFETLYQAIISPQDNDKCLIDIVKLTQLQLQALSVSVMETGVACSYRTPNLYSYRAQTHAQKPATGRMAMVVAYY